MITYISDGKGKQTPEFGTWTPRLEDDRFEFQAQAYTIQDGRFTKIGDRVFFEFKMKTISLGALIASQACNVVGFPFPIVGDISTCQLVQGTALALPTLDTVTGRFDEATQAMRIMTAESTLGHNSLTIGQWSQDGDMKFTGHYRTNP